MYKGKIIITLKSDLCMGSGYSYAGIVDSDICYDEVGIPYIPGKRLKGCFRETANTYLHALYDAKIIDNIFGERGQNKAANLTLGNAYIKGYSDIHKIYADKIKDNPGIYNQQSFLGMYSRIIGQTKLNDKGSAEEGSLRYTRVVNHYLPLSESEEMVFEAYVTADISKEDVAVLSDVIEATKNIGLKRNRGLGSVKCEITDLTEYSLNKVLPTTDIEGADDIYTINLEIMNIDPLVLSAENSEDTEDYILGQNLLGVLAGRYLAMDGTSAEDKAFKDMFLNGTVTYSNIYPSVDGVLYYPAPEYLVSMKKSKALVNLLDVNESNRIEQIEEENEESRNYSRRNGNQPKKLRGKYVATDKELNVATTEVDKDIMYHHSHYIENSDGDIGLLYTLKAITPGQHFSGEITTPYKYADLIMLLLKQEDMYFGKSKTAQYGRCALTEEPTVEKHVTKYKEYRSGEKVVVTFQSDAAFIKDNGEYSVYSDEISEIIAHELGIMSGEYEVSGAFIKSATITGYLSVWNLKRATIPAIKAGSALIFTLRNDISLPNKNYIGERNMEGYGRVSILPIEDMHYKVSGFSNNKSNDIDTDIVDKKVVEVLKEIEIKDWLKKEKVRFIDNKQIQNMNASALGRITLMLKESLTLGTDYRDQYKLFVDRIESIKSDRLKAYGERLLKIFGKKNEDTWVFNWLNDDVSEERKKYWGECLMTMLVTAKYEKGDR